MTKTKKFAPAVAMGRRGGRVKSPKKAAAVRLNGLKGGRKRSDGLPTLTAERKAAGISYPKPEPAPKAPRKPPPPRARALRWEF